MIFQLGALFLLGSVSVSSALPPCVCTRNLKPVCGSDGQTYSNECLLQCAQVSDPLLFLESNGRCDGTSLGPPRDVRQAPCTVCTLEYMPLCGTDGRTYPNRCTLTCANVGLAHAGECRQKRETIRTPQEASECSCPRDIAPVCGTDGNTYENACSLKCAKEFRPNLDTLYVGICDDNVRIMTEVCVGCTLKVRPVCGTDGNTYRNPCMLNCAREQDESLHIDYEGPCDSRFAFDLVACPDCTRKVKPVCGSDGITYRNPCVLNCARKFDDNLEIKHEGLCGTEATVGEAENL